jgi:FADH2 O2-dependent halogenase
MPRVAWRASQAAGDRWALLPSAAGFVDPLFSTGFPLTLLGVERLARALEEGSLAPDGGAPDEQALAAYARTTLAEADHAARFVAGCYAAFPHFDRFAAFSMFYFAAASFSEMARRLGRTAPGFLFAADDAFTAAMARLSLLRKGKGQRATGKGRSRSADRVLDERVAYAAGVADAVERLNVAGLCDDAKRNWYGVDLEDAVRGAAKLGATEEEVRRLTPRPARSPAPGSASPTLTPPA